MKIMLQTHTYAPELNKAFLGPERVMVPMPYVPNIKGVRARFKPSKWFIHATATVRYDDPSKKWLQRTIAGKVESRAEAITFAKELRTRLAEGGRVELRTRGLGA